MAWCPHCEQDRPIRRIEFIGPCKFCGGDKKVDWWSGREWNTSSHKEDCRGPAYGKLDVCTYCNTPVFAKARSESEYERFAEKERRAKERTEKKEGCFVVTVAVGNANDPIVCNMRQFRDEILIRKRLGRVFINWYYKYGPRMAERIKESFFLKKLCYVLILIPTHLIVKFILDLVRKRGGGILA